MEKRIIHIRIRDLRRERELTQEELAEALGISRQSINAMEAGRCLPSLPVAVDIASFFAVPLNQLVALADEHQRMLRELDTLMQGEVTELIAPSTDPAVNITENATGIEVAMVLPGFRKDEIALDIGDTFITVSGAVSSELSYTGHVVRREFTPSPFSRTIQLPSAVQSEGASAQMRNGILTIQLHKLPALKPATKRLEISAD